MTQRYEITGPLRFLNHSCRPNAGLSGFELVALRPITAGEEILIDYGPDACTCRQHEKVAAVGSAAVEHAA
jgi:SET domain-containing protein